MKSVQRQFRQGIKVQRLPVRRFSRPAGAATLDYILVLCAILPMMALSYTYSLKIIRAVYEMTCTLVCWPFM